MMLNYSFPRKPTRREFAKKLRRISDRLEILYSAAAAANTLTDTEFAALGRLYKRSWQLENSLLFNRRTK